jgi:hypothetical protein
MDLQKTDIAYNMLHGYGKQLIFILVCHLAMENSCVNYSTSASWLWSTAYTVLYIHNSMPRGYGKQLMVTTVYVHLLHGYGVQLIFTIVCRMAMENS